MPRIRTTVLTTATAALLLAACSGEESSTAGRDASSGGIDGAVFAANPIGEGDTLPGIGEVKRSAATGEKVRFVARVGGRATCFVPSSAVMIVADPVLEDCLQKGDGCPKPWDYCCEPPERIKANTATVRVVDGSGIPVPQSMEGAGGLVPLKTIEVLGTVAESGPEGLFVVDAERIFVVPG